MTKSSEEFKNIILTKARELFLTLGYHKTTMRNIAQAAGISTSPLYAHFGNKTEVFVAICSEGVERLLNSFQKAATKDDHALLRLCSIFYAYRDFYLHDSQYFQILQLAFNPLSGIDMSEEIRQSFLQKKQEVLTIMMQVVETGVKNNEIRTNNAKALMLCLYSFSEGIFLINESDLYKKYGLQLDDIIEQATELMAFGMAYLPD